VPGTVYRIVRMIGAGGMGTVYDVEDTTVGKRYVLKTLHPELYGRKDLAKRMQAEARTLARLSHPNIVEVVTAGATTDDLRLPFYVMEKLNGQNLRTILNKKGSLDLPHALHIGIDLLDALDNAHDKGVIHRDVKPDNIFLHRNTNGVTTTKLLDFGIMRLLDAGPGVTAGRFMGTLRYAAPEQLRGDSLSAQTDLYAAGLVVYEMIAGRGPFDELEDANKIAAAHINMAPPSFVSLGAVVPSTLEKLVLGALSKDATKRPKDAFTFAAQLRNMKRTLSLDKPMESATSRPTEVPVVGLMTDVPSSPNQLRLSPSSGPVSEGGAASPAAFADTQHANTRAGAPVAKRGGIPPEPPTSGQTAMDIPSGMPTMPGSGGATLIVQRPPGTGVTGEGTPSTQESAVVASRVLGLNIPGDDGAPTRRVHGIDVPTEASPVGPINRSGATHSAVPPGLAAPFASGPRAEGSTEPIQIVNPGASSEGADFRPATLRMNPPSPGLRWGDTPPAGGGAAGMSPLGSPGGAAVDDASQLLALLPTEEPRASRTDDPASNTLSPKVTRRARPFVAIAVGLATTLAMVGTFGVIAWGISHRDRGAPTPDPVATVAAPVSDPAPGASASPPVSAAAAPAPPPSAAAPPIPAPTIPPPLDTATAQATASSAPAAASPPPAHRAHAAAPSPPPHDDSDTPPPAPKAPPAPVKKRLPSSGL